MRVMCYEHSGFCSGVRRAVNMALELSREEEDVYTLGPLVHNEEVEKYLSSKGVKMADSLDDVVKGNLIIRTHGEGPEIFNRVRNQDDIELHDATCPLVNKVQKLASELTAKGKQVVIWGKPDHPEVRSIVKWTGEKAIVISTLSELTRQKIRAPAVFMSQTTQERTAFDAAAGRFKTIFRDGQVYDTLCPTVKRLQDAAEKMASRVDLMVIIGSPMSSNTEKLLRLCIRKTPTIRVSGAADIKKDLFYDTKTVGVIAGASTPDWIIKEVLVKMDEVKRELLNTEEGKENESQDLEMVSDSALNDAETASPEKEEETPVSESSPEETKEESQETVAEESAPQPDDGESLAEETVAPVEEERKTLEEIKAELQEDRKKAEEDKGEPEASESFYFVDEIKTLKEDDVATGVVVSAKEEGIMVDLGDKTEALLPPGEVFLNEDETLESKFPVGTSIEVLVIKVNDQDGEMEVSHRRLERKQVWENIKKALDEKSVLSGTVKNVVSAGMTVGLGAGIEAFMPGSLVDVRYVPDLKKYKGEEISFKVIEINPDREKVIISRKEYMEEINEVKKKETFAKIKEGDVISGVVRRLAKFGAFVDVGGVDGLVHISELSWGRIKRPEDALSVGDEIKVKVIQVVPDEGKISLSYRSTQPDPWEQVSRKFKIGQIINGTVTRLAKFGAFVEIIPGVEGLVHISHVADHHIKHPSEAIKEGAPVEVKILDLRPEDKRVSLSIKEAMAKKVEKSVSLANSSGSNDDNGSGVTLGDVFGKLFNNGNGNDAAADEKTEPETVAPAPAEEGVESEPEVETEIETKVDAEVVAEVGAEVEVEAEKDAEVASSAAAPEANEPEDNAEAVEEASSENAEETEDIPEEGQEEEKTE